MYLVMTAGINAEIQDTGKVWTSWLADASTAFLQGRQPDGERPLPLFMRPPADEISAMTGQWSSELYRIKSNVYGLSNAPRLWCAEVTKRLLKLNYVQHSFDRMLFLKRDQKGEIISLIMVYVDDFLGTYRSDYNIEEVKSAFTWGSYSTMEPGETYTFKGKQLRFKERVPGRFVLEINQKEFIDGMQGGKLRKGRVGSDDLLTPEERAEFRSVAGSLQWLCGQSRPELSPAVSLSNKGLETRTSDLKNLFDAVDYAKETSTNGISIMDVPLNKASVIMTYADSSWANADRCRSQFGTLALLTTTRALTATSPGTLLDWKSGRSARVCRSTLAAEASAADEGCDRGSFINMHICEILYDIPAHRVGPRLLHLHATDAKSLYDSAIQDNPNLTDKRLLVNVRAIQEVIPAENLHWVPTDLQHADGLTKVNTDLRQTFGQWLQSPSITLREQVLPKENSTGENSV